MLSKVWLSLYAWFLNVSTPTVEAVTDFGPESVVSSDIFLSLRYFLHQNSFIAFIADKRRIFTWTTTLVGCPIDVEQMLRLFTSLRALITLTMTEKNLRRQKKIRNEKRHFCLDDIWLSFSTLKFLLQQNKKAKENNVTTWKKHFFVRSQLLHHRSCLSVDFIVNRKKVKQPENDLLIKVVSCVWGANKVFQLLIRKLFWHISLHPKLKHVKHAFMV